MASGVWSSCRAESVGGENAPSVEDLKAWEMIDLGPAAVVPEVRGALITETADGPILASILLDRPQGKDASRASLLMVELLTGESSQHFYPDPDAANGAAYCILATSWGTFIYQDTVTFHEFDLVDQEYLFTTGAIEGLVMSMAESDDGLIYVATYPKSQLYVYDPIRQEIRDVIRLDAHEQYPSYMKIGQDGWVYVGMGNAKSNLVAYHPSTGELRQLAKESERGVGSGLVQTLTDGTVIGRAHSSQPWRLLEDGEVGEIMEDPQIVDQSGSVYWLKRRFELEDGLKVISFDVQTRKLRYQDADNAVYEIDFDFTSPGASISSMIATPDGRIMGSCDHPNQLWTFNPKTSSFEVHGGIPELGGGNLTRFIEANGRLISNSYALGNLYAIDSSQPVLPAAKGEALNPKVLAKTHPLIGRPRALIKHSDGQHLVSTGYPGYGYIGGGMLIYDYTKDEVVSLTGADNLIPSQSITAITELPDGNLILGGSILTPGGAKPVAERASLARFDWESQAVTDCWDFPEDVQTISDLISIDGRSLHVVAGNHYYLYNLSDDTIRADVDLGSYGGPASRRGDTAFFALPDGRLFLVAQKALFEIDNRTGDLDQRASFPMPVTDVGPVSSGILYLASSGHLIGLRIGD